MKKEYYAHSRGERDTKKRKTNIKYFNGVFYDDIVRKEEKLRKNVVKYPELKEYRKGGNRHTNMGDLQLYRIWHNVNDVQLSSW